MRHQGFVKYSSRKLNSRLGIRPLLIKTGMLFLGILLIILGIQIMVGLN